MQVVLQLARAVAEQDVKLLQRVVRDLPALADTVEGGFGRVWITDQAKMDEFTQGIVRRAISHEVERATDNHSTAKPRGGRLVVLRWQTALWATFARKYINVAIIRSDGSLASSEQEAGDELG